MCAQVVGSDIHPEALAEARAAAAAAGVAGDVRFSDGPRDAATWRSGEKDAPPGGAAPTWGSSPLGEGRRSWPDPGTR